MVEQGVLLALAVLAWAINPARRLAHLGWLALTAALFVFAVRNGPVLALACLFVLAANAAALDTDRVWKVVGSRLSGRLPAKVRPAPPLFTWPFRLAVVAFLALQLASRWADLYLAEPLSPTELEDGAVAFMRAHTVSGNGFNDYESSSYLQWAFAGSPPLAIDLLNANADAVADDYEDIVNVSPRGRSLLAREDLAWVLLTARRPGPSLAALADYLDASPSWLRVYHGTDGIVWVRRTPANEARFHDEAEHVPRGPFATLELVSPVRLPLP